MASGRPPDREVLAETYRILEKLDANGRIFKAHDRRHRRIVALRILSPFGPDPSAPRAFRRVIEAASRLQHPNLAAVLGADEDRGVPFVVMQHVDGSDIERVVRERGPLPLGQAIDILGQAASGLEAAHAQGIVHRRLKPSRLMLEATGMVRVLGLGLTGVVGSEVDPRAADFMAPELAEDPRRSDPRADIYSLGCILYFVLTGRQPFVGDSLQEKLTAHRDRPAPELRVLRPDVPSTLAAAYQRMMAKRPEDRPASMTEVIGLLQSGQAVVSEASARSAPGGRGREERPARRPEAEAPVFASGEESAGVPIGPEFDLGGLGLEGRSPAGPGPTRKAPIGLRLGESTRSESDEPAIPRRLIRPAIALGLAAFAVAGAVALRSVFRPGEAGSPRSIAKPSAGDDGGLVAVREVDRETEGNPQPPPRPEWVSRTIFDGKDARDWMLTSKRPLPRKHVQPDGLNPHRTGSYLVVYKHKLGDFILDFDYKLSRGCKSGVFLRVGDLDDPVNTGIEVSIADSPGTSDEAPGAIHGLLAPSVNAQKPAGQWNHMTITAQGPVIVVSLNGRDVSRIHLDEWTEPGRRPDGGAHRFAHLAFARLPRRGYLGFQDLVGDCWFKNIVLKTPATSWPDDTTSGDGRSTSR